MGDPCDVVKIRVDVIPFGQIGGYAESTLSAEYAKEPGAIEREAAACLAKATEMANPLKGDCPVCGGPATWKPHNPDRPAEFCERCGREIQA